MAVQWPPIICSLLACCLCLLLLFASPLWHANTAVNTQRPLRPPPCCVPVGAGGAEHQKTGGSGQLLGRTHLASPGTQTQHTNLEVLCMSWCADFEFRVTQTHLWDVRSQTRTSSMTRVWRTSTRLPYPTRFSSLPTRYCSLALLPVSALYKLLSSHPSARARLSHSAILRQSAWCSKMRLEMSDQSAGSRRSDARSGGRNELNCRRHDGRKSRTGRVSRTVSSKRRSPSRLRRANRRKSSSLWHSRLLRSKF